MNKITPLAVAAALMIVGASSAEAGWKRNKVLTGPYGGTVVTNGSGSCANGVCTSAQTKTGPYGNTATRNGAISCDGLGNCASNATITGPAGKKFKRSGSFSVQ
jgi:hypothetical protein